MPAVGVSVWGYLLSHVDYFAPESQVVRQKTGLVKEASERFVAFVGQVGRDRFSDYADKDNCYIPAVGSWVTIGLDDRQFIRTIRPATAEEMQGQGGAPKFAPVQIVKPATDALPVEDKDLRELHLVIARAAAEVVASIESLRVTMDGEWDGSGMDDFVARMKQHAMKNILR